MKCPRCGSMDNRVIESRTLASGESIRRRRECAGCGFRFTSYERIVEKQLMIVKNSKRREPFSREKLERGIHRALEKRNISQREIEEIVNDLEDKASLHGGSDHEIPSSLIGEMVLEKLYHIDRVAYVRFASVYRNFADLEEFIREIENFTKEID